jgi:hypothetical protein
LLAVPDDDRGPPGIDWRSDRQVALLRDVLAAQVPPRFATGPSRPREAADKPVDTAAWARLASAHHRLTPAGTSARPEYHAGNAMFGPLDAWVLKAMLRHLRPRQVIEVGCGWSSLVTASLSTRHLGGSMQLTCIDPSPPPWLHGEVPGISELLRERAQEVPIERYLELRAGDVLFIDSSHVARAGSDVCFLFHEVVPQLADGVVVHAHDIFLPNDYPETWIADGRGWNEQYLIQSLLTFNSRIEILLGLAWMRLHHPEVLAAAAPGLDAGGAASLWMRRSLVP